MTQEVDDEDVVDTTPGHVSSPGTRAPERPAPGPRLAAMVVAGFTALAVGVSVLGGDLLNPPPRPADGDYAARRWSC